ncbi:olfactory receptor 10AG1-like [Apodemus sylvaticus]|uniref:olfactory receptor 10AG1-like n=1 Tax=Apodemus sylvaticus TaxID=10129 RepID=UPI002244AECD|nr:olfactory receptor 10AG1-like [Apodemus sylvaticus]
MEHTQIRAKLNASTVTQFILLRFYEIPNLQGFLFGMFLIIYLIILIGNSFITVITRIDPALQKPMYFFLANFSTLEVCYVSVTLPRILFNIATQGRHISVLSCDMPTYFYLMLGVTECFLLAVMSYDRYVVICNPLHYPLVMNPTKWTQLAAGSWLGGIPVQIVQTCQIFSLHFCNSNQIEHFFCDLLPILKLAYGDTSMHELAVYLVAILFAVVPFIMRNASYSKIIATILRLPTATGQTKSFSTCSSHLLVVFLFFGSASVTYSRLKSTHFPGTDKNFSLFYTIVTPMFNSLIYSFRNNDVIGALRKLLCRKQCQHVCSKV